MATPVYIAVSAIIGVTIAPILARLHLGVADTKRVRESSELTAEHERSIRVLTRVYRIIFASAGVIGLVSWFSGFGWSE